jgi:hypothetical protein
VRLDDAILYPAFSLSLILLMRLISALRAFSSIRKDGEAPMNIVIS